MKAFWKECTAAVAATLCAASVFAFAGCTDSSVSFGHYGSAEEYSVGGFTRAAADINSVSIAWMSGSVTIKHTDSDEFKVRESCNVELDDDHKLHWRIYTDAAGEPVLDIKAWGSDVRGKSEEGEKDITVEVPKTLRKLDVDNVSSTVVITDITCTSDIDVNTVSGAVTLDGSTSAPKLSANGMSGSISLHCAMCENVKIDVSSGSVDVTAPFKSLDINSMSGSVAVTLDRSKRTQAKFTTLSGKLETEQTFERDKGTMFFGEGSETVAVVVDTISGTFNIR